MSCMHSECCAVLENSRGGRDEADETAAQVGFLQGLAPSLLGCLQNVVLALGSAPL